MIGFYDVVIVILFSMFIMLITGQGSNGRQSVRFSIVSGVCMGLTLLGLMIAMSISL